jgi:nuclear RNA export factor
VLQSHHKKHQETKQTAAKQLQETNTGKRPTAARSRTFKCLSHATRNTKKPNKKLRTGSKEPLPAKSPRLRKLHLQVLQSHHKNHQETKQKAANRLQRTNTSTKPTTAKAAPSSAAVTPQETQRNHKKQNKMPGAPRRGGAARRHARADRDGDLTMDVAAKTRGRIGKTKSAKDPSSRGSKNGILSNSAQRSILRKAAAGDVNMKEANKSLRSGLIELQITGWTKSKASDGSDRGVGALIKWLEKKASLRLGSGRRDVKIKKSRVVEDDLFINVPEQDANALTRMNGYGWAGTTINIKRTGGTNEPTISSQAEQTKAMLRGVLERRYNPDLKFLDLSALGQDEELKSQAIFDSKSTASKFFPAMMRVLSLVFDTPAELHAAIESVSLANNDLVDLKSVSSLSETLPKLHNLDLSNNKFENLEALGLWRKRFLHLQHIIVTNNPLEQNETEFAAQFLKWYPNLRMINNIQVRTEEELANKTGYLPFPIKGPIFLDEGGIAEGFVRNWFLGYDTDRRALVQMYYDDLSDFSYALNTAAPRDPAGTVSTEKQEWDAYIKNSRNLKKISQLPARINRSFKGAQAVGDMFESLPKSKHPDLATEANKWMIEAHPQVGIPDITGQSTHGVDGFCITVNGEFDEIDKTTGQPTKKRSCDHVFMIGPGGPTGVRVVSHQITIRAYGGAQAFQAPIASPPRAQPSPQQSAETLDAPAQLPPGITLELAEQMVTELTKRTNMTLVYSKNCLEQTGWNFDAALAAFESVKATLPMEAYNAAPVA